MLKGKPRREVWLGGPGVGIAKNALGRGLKCKKIVHDGEIPVTIGNGAVLRFKPAEEQDSFYGGMRWSA